DVVPPARRRYSDVEDVLVGDGMFVADVDLDRFPAVGADARDTAVDVEGRGDSEGVPGAISIPRAASGLDPVRRRDGRERIRHPTLGSVRLEHESVRGVKAAERRLDLVAQLVFQLGEGRCPSELDEPP